MAIPAMTKPFDIQVLVAMLQAAGLPIVESAAKAVVDQAVLPWLSQSLTLEAATNSIFAIGLPVLAALQPVIDAELAKIAPAS